MKFLVLGGGSIKGAWQAGAIRAVLENGYKPDFITGISVGSVNGAHLVNGRNKEQWADLGIKLWDFWIENIKKPSDIAIKRKAISLIWQIIRNRFKGLTDSTPLWNIINKTVSYYNITNSPCKLAVGVVNINDGKIEYVEPHSTNYLEYIYASAAIPIAFPVSHIANQAFYDGGLRDSAPLKIAFDKGASEIVCIACHPKDLGGAEINTGNLMQLIERLQDIIVNNNINNDIDQAESINYLCPADGSEKSDEPHKGKRRIPLKIIRPETPINVSLDSFNSNDIRMMLESGYSSAKRSIEKP